MLSVGQQPALYVFNYKEGGFSIISADKHLMPVLAYSTTSIYTNTDKPGGLLKWEQKTAQCVADAKAATTPLPTQDITREWEYSLNPTANRQIRSVANDIKSSDLPVANRLLPPDDSPQGYSVTVGPLVPVTWGQGCTYNEQCPSGNSACGHKWTGCVMTSMAQIMAYWRYPSRYNWANMPTASGNADVQQLMADAGKTMPSADYSKDDGTGASLSEVAVFGAGFKSGLQYSSANYISYNSSTVKNNLATRRPVILGGCTGQTNRFLGIIYTYDGCHAWVCDGYQESSSYSSDGSIQYYSLLFHMNWGWHEQNRTAGAGPYGDYNGWFNSTNWNISGINRNYQYANDAIVDIHP